MTVIFNRRRKISRIRKRLKETGRRFRLSVFKSNHHVWLQIIDDLENKTLVSANSKEIFKKSKVKKTEAAFEVGKLLAERASEQKISEVVFDRGRNRYQGRIKAIAEGARAGGLKF